MNQKKSFQTTLQSEENNRYLDKTQYFKKKGSSFYLNNNEVVNMFSKDKSCRNKDNIKNNNFTILNTENSHYDTSNFQDSSPAFGRISSNSAN